MYGPGPSVRNSNEGNDLKSVVMPGNSLPMLSNEINFQGEITGQNLHVCWSPRSNLNTNYGGCILYPRDLQTAPRPGDELYSIDFSQSLTQILASMGHNLNTNPKEGFKVIPGKKP